MKTVVKTSGEAALSPKPVTITVDEVRIPMLFLQGTRDDFAELKLLQGLVEQLGSRATLKLFENADHSFHVPARTGRTDAEVRSELLETMAAWMERVLSGSAISAGKPE